jgi:hypothetical protein
MISSSYKKQIKLLPTKDFKSISLALDIIKKRLFNKIEQIITHYKLFFIGIK